MNFDNLDFKNELLFQVEVLKRAQKEAESNGRIEAVDFISQTIYKYLEMLNNNY